MVQSEAMQKKTENLELAVQQAEMTCAVRVEEVVTLTEKAIAAVKAEKDALQTKLNAAQADITMTEQLKKQLSDYQALEERNTSEINSLQQKLRSLQSTQRLLESDLKKSREREAALSKAAAAAATASAAATAAAQHGAASASSEAVDVAQLAQQRARDIESELDNARSSINELILEIEAVSSEEAKSRAKCGELLKQISDCQSMQRVALEENLHLQNENEDLKKSHKEVEAK